MPTPLQSILQSFRDASVTEREKGTYFEELIRTYLRYEPVYADLYSDVWLLSDVPAEYSIPRIDTGIDLVAKTRGTGELHAIQCKFYDERYHIKKSDIDSFFTASGNKAFSHRVIVSTTNSWSENAEAALINQNPPVVRIDLADLEDSQIDWSKYKPHAKTALKSKFAPRPHQQTAIKRVVEGLSKADRGKLIMACGTGKTFTSLKIAEQMAGAGKRVLFLVPSLALLSQSLTEWTQQSETPLHCFAVCSDAEVGKKRKADDDVVQTFVHELRYPAVTDAKRLSIEVSKRQDNKHMTVVFSTYHSIGVISDAQRKHKLDEFDLIICDEAHRTTGATFEDDEESAFVRVHDQKFIKGGKRLYMTATPRIYADSAKATALQDNIAICSMDDEELYGEQLHVINFSEAVELGLLTDYKVIVLAIDEDHVSTRLQSLLKDDNNQLKVDDAARIIGCWKALSKVGLHENPVKDTEPMKRAVAFCQVIEPTTGKKQHKVSSKQIAQMFQDVIDAYQESAEEQDSSLHCETDHVDGSMNAAIKGQKLTWLKENAEADVCRILCNVRCLSEGVDVPALDAVLFLSPRNSQVEVVQSVGRVMRRAPDKKLGYVILPVVIPHGMEPHEALNDNKVYKVVWDVLQALRSHDDRFDSFINKLDLMQNPSGKMEVVAITDTLSRKTKTTKADVAKGSHTIGIVAETKGDYQHKIQFNVGELEKALYARLVKKCGNRLYWEEWAGDIAKIAQTHIGRIQAILSNPKNTKEIKAFAGFANELRDDLNDSITDEEVIEMLAQHLITKPVFDALFSGYSFASHNPVSQGMQNILDLLNEHRLDKEADTLEQFYDSVRRRAAGIDKAEGKQKIVVELYDKFFRNAFPRMTERLGIVYTPVEVVDFIIHSVNDILQEEFGLTLGSKGVHILDPFVGTGTFVTRLMQSGLITPEQLPHKYKHEIHANEIVLLAYYIAAINIEAVYHSIVGGKYVPFDGICLTDTFQMYESSDMLERFFPDNSERRKRQKKLDIRVIVGNPPYSAMQESENDNNKNVAYPALDDRIRSTYAAHSTATLKNALYDSYVRAIRWASDRVGASGIVAFVTNAGFLDANTADGMRRCLENEFCRIDIFHLRGNQRTSGERSRKEGGKIFGSGSRAPIAITLLVKRPAARNKTARAAIRWCDIGDYLSREEKLGVIADFRSVNSITESNRWVVVKPNVHNDWTSQRDDSFGAFMLTASKDREAGPTLFSMYSSGIKTNRDAWCYNFCEAALKSSMGSMIEVYNREVRRYGEACKGLSPEQYPDAGAFINADPTQISWTREIKQSLERGMQRAFEPNSITAGYYRPFQKTWVYFNRDFNNCVYKMPSIFPNEDLKNLVISFTGTGVTKEFTVLMLDRVIDVQIHANGQSFPRYVYECAGSSQLFDDDIGAIATGDYVRKDAITDEGLTTFRAAYAADDVDRTITKDDLFYYVYGLLHSEEYRARYADNLSKELPRIPAVKKFADFQAFGQAGRDLAHWHLNYETVDCYPVTFDLTGGATKLKALQPEQFRVVKMKFPRRKDPDTGKSVSDKSTVIYNEFITVTGIPLEAYDYVVNGKPAIEWVMERQAVTTDKDSGIVNDANLWATETMNNPAYPLELLQRVITVSLETMKIVNSLPQLEIA
ncbi:MAG: type ISP restriction/modification enzyme [Pirellulaceae bacterium]